MVQSSEGVAFGVPAVIQGRGDNNQELFWVGRYHKLRELRKVTIDTCLPSGYRRVFLAFDDGVHAKFVGNCSFMGWGDASMSTSIVPFVFESTIKSQ